MLQKRIYSKFGKIMTSEIFLLVQHYGEYDSAGQFALLASADKSKVELLEEELSEVLRKFNIWNKTKYELFGEYRTNVEPLPPMPVLKAKNIFPSDQRKQTPEMHAERRAIAEHNNLLAQNYANANIAFQARREEWTLAKLKELGIEQDLAEDVVNAIITAKPVRIPNTEIFYDLADTRQFCVEAVTLI